MVIKASKSWWQLVPPSGLLLQEWWKTDESYLATMQWYEFNNSWVQTYKLAQVLFAPMSTNSLLLQEVVPRVECNAIVSFVGSFISNETMRKELIDSSPYLPDLLCELYHPNVVVNDLHSTILSTLLHDQVSILESTYLESSMQWRGLRLRARFF